MKRVFFLAAIALCFGVICATAEEDAIIRLEPLVQEAIDSNPKILTARERYSALKEKIAQAGALDDPMLSFGVVNLPNTFDFDEEDMTAKEIAVSQRLPFPGKRSLSEKAAAKEAEAGAAEVDGIANQVTLDVKTTFYDLSHAYRAMDVTRRNKSILEELVKITRTRYSLGQGIQEDVLRNQVEISKMVDDLIMLEQKKRSLAAKLNYILNRPHDSPLGRPAEVVFRPVELSIEALQLRAAESNPMLKALKQEISARGKNVELAKREYFPDFNLKVAYGQRENRPDMYTGMIEMNLPIFYNSKQERKVVEAYADARSTQARYDSALSELQFAIADGVSMLQRLERKIALYRTGIIPQARLQIDTALSAYMVNKADFMTLLDSRMQLYRYELEFHDALTEYEKSLAVLESAVGTPFSREVMK